MKKRLNNIFKGKILVTGDVKDLNPNEILLTEVDGKVVAKELGADGKAKDISGGEGSSNPIDNMPHIVYYLFDTSATPVVNQVVKEGDFTTFQDFFDYANYPESPVEGAKVNAMVYLGTEKSLDNENIVFSANNSEYAEVSIDATNSKGNELVGGCTKEYSNALIMSMITTGDTENPNVGISNYCVKIPPATDDYRFTFYNALENALLWYGYCTSLSITIKPEELASTLKVYLCNIRALVTSGFTVNGEPLSKDNYIKIDEYPNLSPA